LNPLQVAFFRNLFAVVFMLPWILKGGGQIFKTNRRWKHISRAGLVLMARYPWFFAISILPLAEAVSLNFTVPIFVTIGAIFFLHEQVGRHRWGATLFGFLGVIVILRPGFMEISPYMALPIIAAMFMASTALIVKSLSSTESTGTIIAYMNVLLTPLSFIPAFFVWQWPSFELFGLLLLLGALAVLAHLLSTQAYKYADASALMPFLYLRLPFVAIMAFFLFGETSDIWTWVGAAMVAVSALYIAHREARNHASDNP
jgi:drug/metabolite transporter (DMT)-like permease